MHPLIRRSWEGVNRLLAPLDVAVVRRSAAESLGYKIERRPASGPPLPDGAQQILRPDHPRLAELTRRYRHHPAGGASEWSNSYLDPARILPYFRADSPYLWQQEGNVCIEVQYALTALYVSLHDPLGMLETVKEDGLFGARTVLADGRMVSRDLLDSVLELSFLEEEAGISKWDAPTVLDIGAGYGRLAHRGAEAVPGSTWLCTDGVPLSTFLCEYYLAFRDVGRAEVVPLDEIASALIDRRVDLAVNVHSFSECSVEAIGWWLDLLVAADVPMLMVVPNTEDHLLSTEVYGRKEFLPLLVDRGFSLVSKRQKYARSASVHQYGIVPSWYLLFERR